MPNRKAFTQCKKSFVKFVYFLHADFKYNIVDYFQILYIGNGFYTVYNIIFLILVELSVFGSILFRYANTTKRHLCFFMKNIYVYVELFEF